MSDRNPRVVSALKLVRPAERRKAGRFLAEGPNAVAAALARGAVIELFATSKAIEKHEAIMGNAGCPVWIVSERIAKGLSETVTPQGLVAVCEAPAARLDHTLAKVPPEGFVAVLVDVNEPGNAGTIIRVADAAGAAAVIIAGESVDPLNGKVIRAAAGSSFHLPVVRAAIAGDVVEELLRARFRVLATSARGELSIFDVGEVLSGTRVAWLFGNEAHGLPAAIADRATHAVSIPIRGGAESLNLATAATLCLYESARSLHGSARAQAG
ncbi:TrmH family RNA methyltransferase [Lolliginicoccus lacisalsi]|uniref:TrmH family RNA methyltransferase n=1 Tax=Lolliginicoccus lacisalsi TaxID=2742202 RepID=UPI0038CC1DB6